MGKMRIAAALILIAIVSSALTYAITLKTVQNNMTVSGISAVAIEYPLGTRIESYNWGTFSSIAHAKSEEFAIRNIGNGPVNVNATVTDLPSGWTVSLSQTEWVGIAVNEAKNFTVTVTLNEALPVGNYGFNINFWTP